MENERIQTRLEALRERMRAHDIDMYLVFSQDFHGSEYVGEYFRCREYISGFTGSAGTVVITQEEAGLWTDGRYFLQAEDQLRGTGIRLFKMGQEGVPTVREYVKQNLRDGMILGFDGRTLGASEGRFFAGICPQLVTGADLIGEIWTDRPALSAKPAWLLDDGYTGRSRREKIAWLAGRMKEKKAGWLVISSLDEICWLLNMRGDDVRCNPVVLSYLLVRLQEEGIQETGEAGSKENCCGSGSDRSAEGKESAGRRPAVLTLYINERILKDADRAALAADGVCLAPYDRIYEDISEIPEGERLWLDPASANYEIACRIPGGSRRADPDAGSGAGGDALKGSICRGVDVMEEASPLLHEKAVKNEAELAGMRRAHIKDGIALTRFMYWLKTHVGKVPLTEIGASDKMEEFRKLQEGYLGPSFDPISGFGPHGAIVHYSATPQTDAKVEGDGLLLMDTGGQYLDGTTDITRTFVCGKASEEEKRYFTLVLRGHLHLMAARFLEGCRGYSLDVLARQPLWENGLDYNHGTGHGVGCLLNVHEGPVGIRWRIKCGDEDRDSCVFEPGMITSNEPGLYIEGKCGVRHENLMACVKDEENEFGRFLRFETLTMVPFDLDGIDEKLMTDREKQILNRYHKKVYETVAPYLPDEERQWLQGAVREI